MSLVIGLLGIYLYASCLPGRLFFINDEIAVYRWSAAWRWLSTPAPPAWALPSVSNVPHCPLCTLAFLDYDWLKSGVFIWVSVSAMWLYISGCQLILVVFGRTL